MLKLVDGSIEFNYSSCQQCGICESVCPRQAITMKFLANGLHKVILDKDKCVKCQKCINCCPANITKHIDNYLKELSGKLYFLGCNKDKNIRSESSSGGVCKTLIINSLKQGLVDGVYTMKKITSYPSGEGEFYTIDNIPSYTELSNSIYHSVMIGTQIHKISKSERLMLVGTSCQLRALEAALKGKYKKLIKVCIFCKQQKTLDSTRFLAKIMGCKLPKDLNFSTLYRGGGWPGVVHIEDAQLPWHWAAQLPFGRRLWTVPGCNVCGDPFGMECNADLTLMDPWTIKNENNLGDTLITVHTQEGMALLEKCDDLIIESQTFEDIKPALGMGDVWRKRTLVPYFRGETNDKAVIRAAKAELLQRKFLSALVMWLPKLPIVCYRLLFHIPDLRNYCLKCPSE